MARLHYRELAELAKLSDHYCCQRKFDFDNQNAIKGIQKDESLNVFADRPWQSIDTFQNPIPSEIRGYLPL